MAVKLSILICTIPSRSKLLSRLLRVLDPQLSGDVEVLIDEREGISIGSKRQDLLEGASGDYIAFIDDDDLVAKTYVSSILTAIEATPDCVGIRGVIMHFGNWPRFFIHSLECGGWVDGAGGNEYFRTPNHLNPVMRILALECGGFTHGMNFAEDRDYSKRLLPFLTSEVTVPEVLYYYLFNKRVV